MKTVGIAIAVLLLSACGQVAMKPATSPVAQASATPVATPTQLATPSATPSVIPASPTPTITPTPVPTPKVSSTLLFAVLEAKGTANAWTYNTVAIAGLDGYARAKTTFTPMSVPKLGCMGAILPPSAYVAAGKVFFADGHGVIRSLGIDNKVSIVATFPMTSAQQMLSFAVSPDGTQIVGTLFTIPTTANLACGSSSSGTFTFDAYAVTGPTTTRLVYHQSWTSPPSVMALTGWDTVGPFGTYPTVWASQGGGPGSTLGVRVRIDTTTLKPGAQFADPTKCQVWDSVPSGIFLCNKDAATVSVRQSDGVELWKGTVPSPYLAESCVLAPDAQHFKAEAALVVGRDGSVRSLADGFFGSGWLDSTTMIGEYRSDPLAQPPFNLRYVALNSPTYAVDLGFKGAFVGTVRP